jgi:lipopolysaccharide/colanic/teichoic acid biosynthesis glycosyltransferase
MSIIGPRPQPKYYGPYYTEEEFHIYDVRGGLLPPDSLGGKPICTWEEQFKYELFYVNHVSLFLDLRVLFYTFLVLVRRLKTNYGLDERPHLNEYRATWNVSENEINKWNNKGVE